MATTPVDGIPTKSGISISDQLGGQFGLAGILSALFARERSSKGVHLDIAMQDCSAWATQARWNGTTERAARNHCGIRRTRRPRRGRDRLCRTPRRCRPPRLSEGSRPWGLPPRRSFPSGEVMEHPQTAARGLLKTVPTADNDEWLVLGSPIRLLSTPADVRSAMPRLGFVHVELARGTRAASDQYPAADEGVIAMPNHARLDRLSGEACRRRHRRN